MKSNHTMKDISLYMSVRLVLLFIVLITTVIYLRLGTVSFENSIINFYLVFFSFLMSTVFIFLSQRAIEMKYFLATQIAYDLLFTSIIIYNAENPDTFFIIFFFINIIFAAVIYQGRGALVTAILSGILYGLILSHKFDLVSALKMPSFIMIPTAMLAIGLLAGQLVEETKKGRQKINRLEKLSLEIVESLDSGLVTVNSNEEVITTNRTAIGLLGLKTENDIIGKKLIDVLPNFINLNFAQIRELKIFDQKRKFLMSTVELLDRQKMIVFRDISEIIDLEERLRRQEKMASVGRLAAGIAHEIRNPVASISGAAQILNEDNSEYKKLLSIITRESDRVSSLVEKLLNFTKPVSTQKEKINCHEFIKECIDSLSARDDFRNLQIVTIIKVDKKLILNANKEQFKEVINNLVVNSMHALQDNDGSKTITISAVLEKGFLVLNVADTGKGIPSEFKNRIYDPFFTTKNSGTGLGLAQVHKIISDHNGTIEVDSEVNKGTNFTIKLPA